MNKKILFLTSTRADFGKLKSLIEIIYNSEQFEVFIFATGMHMDIKYGKTVDEIYKCNFKNIFTFHNYFQHDSMETILSNTINGFSHYVRDIKPDLIVIHGDRVEALAAAIVGSCNCILTAHVEGGEVSGTIDESIRHAVSKLCHVHFVANESAKKRLIQLGESDSSIFIIGSPDIDIMLSDKLPSIESALQRYEIPFTNYSILIFHPVTTEFHQISSQSKNLVQAIIQSNRYYIVIYPNNDIGSDFILEAYKEFSNYDRIKTFSSIRFEYFLVLLRHTDMIVGNSSAGVREAPHYGIPVVNIGSRQHRRSDSNGILNCGYNSIEILNAIEEASKKGKSSREFIFGKGDSDKLFLGILNSDLIWTIECQKIFNDL